VPRVLAVEPGVLVLEHLELTRDGDYAALGRMLAQLHRAKGERFGWPRDNFIGLGDQPNGWSDDWAEFFLEKRLKPQAAKCGLSGQLPDVRGILAGHRPAPSLLHGDLWSGNTGFTADGPVIFDPAVYYGDREADLAMTELFGGFPREFYSAYREDFPLDQGYERRKHLYNLYHLLNHLNLFGGQYLQQVRAALAYFL
jgi:fructosamine-3-kinase